MCNLWLSDGYRAGANVRQTSTCYGLTIGEVCPNKFKFIGVVLCVVPAVVPTGFGAYLAIMLTHTANWRYVLNFF
jgi:hypothetical protein